MSKRKNAPPPTRSPLVYRTASKAAVKFEEKQPAVLFSGDCLKLLKALPDNSIDLVVTSPPYCMGKEYESSTSVDDFLEAHKILLPEIIRVTKRGGSICWQVGVHVANQTMLPLDFAVFALLHQHKTLNLRNRIIWTFDHGLHTQSRFSGRYETVLWYTKGRKYRFDLDAIRVPQKYPGKRHYKGPNKGSFSGNPLGKNPGDVWQIPNVKGNHIEKADHPCQFPVALVQRFIKALCPKRGVVFDPFFGSGSAGVAAAIEGRRFIGAELNPTYISGARSRIDDALNGRAQYRPLERPIYAPSPDSAVAKAPSHFAVNGPEIAASR